MRALLLLLLAWPAACSSQGPGPAAAASGADLYAMHCAQCHGAEGRGNFMNLGPSLAGVKQHWSTDDLLEYIADPKAFAAQDSRLGQREMAAISDTVPLAERKRLVEYVFTELMD